MTGQDRPKTSLTDIPWGPFIGALAGIGVAHVAGHVGSSAVSHGLVSIPVVQDAWNDLTPTVQNRLVKAGLVVAGGLGGAAAMGTNVAHGEFLRRAFEEKYHKRISREKTASVLAIYGAALEGLR